MPLPFALDHINLWILEDGDAVTLVDTGYGNDETRALWERHFADTLQARRIARVVATHCHPDHLGNAAWIAERFGCRVTMTHGEFMSAHAIIDERASHAPADTVELFRRHGMRDEDASAQAARGNRYRHGVPVAPPSFDRIQHGDAVAGAGAEWRVIAGYGHSSEHASLYAASAGVLIAGDMLLPRISTNVAVWPGEPDGDPVARFTASLGRFEALPADTLVLPSHGPPFRGIAARVSRLRAHHSERLAELHAALAAADAPMSAEQVIPVLFRRPLDLQQRFFAMGEAIAHLNNLWRAGRATRSIASDGAIRFAA